MELKKIYNQLEELGLSSKKIRGLEKIREQDGVFLYKFSYNEKGYVLKYFQKEEYTREISNYKILQQLDVPTIKTYGYTSKSVLMEDINKSDVYRLGIASDLDDIEIAKALARWYVQLHGKGSSYILDKKDKFYREIDCITKEKIERVKLLSNTGDNKVWNLIIENINYVMDKAKGLEETLTYNDFYWTNFIVSEDKQKALMFDYNFLGIGF